MSSGTLTVRRATLTSLLARAVETCSAKVGPERIRETTSFVGIHGSVPALGRRSIAIHVQGITTLGAASDQDRPPPGCSDRNPYGMGRPGVERPVAQELQDRAMELVGVGPTDVVRAALHRHEC